MARARRSPFLKLVLVTAAFIALAVFTRTWWLRGLSSILIHDDGPAKADIAVVLGGDYWGGRILKAASLVKQGYVPVVLVSGPEGFYGEHECDPEIAYAVKHGYPEQDFIPFPDEALSTQDEAYIILPELRRRNLHRMLLVTSDYHTARALRTFKQAERKLGLDIDIRAVAAPDQEFHPGSWWQSRQGEKILFMEMTKTIAHAIGL